MATIITPSEVPKFVPGAVTAASDDLGWNFTATSANHSAEPRTPTSSSSVSIGHGAYWHRAICRSRK